jgi:uncharacterized membrane protein YbaN (DUF454 family)
MGIKTQNSLKKDEIRIARNPVTRWVFIISGVFLVGIGILGIFLPLLPTTIFFILAAWCFARSSEKYYVWLHTNRFFGKYLSSYRSGNGMTVKSKIFTTAFLWAGILASAIFFTQNLYVRILLLIIAVGVTWHLLAIKTDKGEKIMGEKKV